MVEFVTLTVPYRFWAYHLRNLDLKNRGTVALNRTVFALFGKKNKKRYGTVNGGDPFKRYAPEEKLRYGTVRMTNCGRTIVF